MWLQLEQWLATRLCGYYLPVKQESVWDLKNNQSATAICIHKLPFNLKSFSRDLMFVDSNLVVKCLPFIRYI